MLHQFINTDSNNRRARRANVFAVLAALVSVAAYGCAPAPTTNSNTTMNSNTTAATANTNTAAMNSNATAAPASATFATREPQQYSLTMTLTGQGAANNRQATLPPQAIEFSRMGTDRRWSFTLPVAGTVVYLEKAAMRYLILPSRRQYVEISPESIGFPLGSALTPSAIVERLKPRAQYENLGSETINGRTAEKYRFTGAADTRTQAGTVQSDSFVYIDEATGLPLRADLNFASSSGGTANGVLETRDINLNPDPQLFAVPTDFKKMTAEELKQQVQGFIQFIRALAPLLNQQPTDAAPPAPNQ